MVKFSSSLLILSISIVNAFSSTLQPTKRPDVLVPSKTLTSRFSSKYGNIRGDPPPTILGASIAASNEENYMDPKSNSSTEIERKRKQSLGSAIFNLVKANVGSGVFALPVSILINLCNTCILHTCIIMHSISLSYTRVGLSFCGK